MPEFLSQLGLLSQPYRFTYAKPGKHSLRLAIEETYDWPYVPAFWWLTPTLGLYGWNYWVKKIPGMSRDKRSSKDYLSTRSKLWLQKDYQSIVSKRLGMRGCLSHCFCPPFSRKTLNATFADLPSSLQQDSKGMQVCSMAIINWFNNSDMNEVFYRHFNRCWSKTLNSWWRYHLKQLKQSTLKHKVVPVWMDEHKIIYPHIKLWQFFTVSYLDSWLMDTFTIYKCQSKLHLWPYAPMYLSYICILSYIIISTCISPNLSV